MTTTTPLPDSVRIFGIEAHGERGIYSAMDPSERIMVEVAPGAMGTRFWACARSHDDVPGSWMVEGPFASTPQAAVAALHDLVRKLAGEIGK